MTTYSTQNPLGSTDPRDLYDNAENLDNFVNGDQPAYNDRLGKSRRSWQSVEDQAAQQEVEFNADQTSREQQFRTFIASSGYQFTGDYAAGIQIAQYNQVVRDTNGEFWRLSGSTTLPYTTTGAGLPEGGAFVAVGDAVLRQELGGSAGASLVGLPIGTVGQAINWVTPQMFGAVGDGVTDDTLAIQSALDSGLNVFFPKGDYAVYQQANEPFCLTLKKNVNLYGSGPKLSRIVSGMTTAPDVSILKIEFSEPLQNFGDVRSWEMKGLYVGGYNGDAKHGLTIDAIKPALQCLIHNCAFNGRWDNGGYGVNIVSGWAHSSIRDCSINHIFMGGGDACVFQKILMFGTGPAFTFDIPFGVRNNVIKDCTIVNRDGALHVINGDNIRFINNQLEQNQSYTPPQNQSQTSAMVWLEGRDRYCRNTIIRDNNFGGGTNVDHGLYIDNAQRTVVDANHWISVNNAEIRITANAKHNLVMPNQSFYGSQSNPRPDTLFKGVVIDEGVGSMGVLQQGSKATAYNGWTVGTFYKGVDGVVRSLGGFFGGTNTAGASVAKMPEAFWPVIPADPSLVNKLRYTQQLDNAAWDRIYTTVDADAVAAPDGSMTADLVSHPTTTSPVQRRIRQTGLGLEANTEYTLSFYGQKPDAASVDEIRAELTDFTRYVRVLANLATGAISHSVNANYYTGVTSGSESVGGGWWRFWVTFTTTSDVNGSAGYAVGFALSNVVSMYSDWEADSAINRANLWGAQLNLGPLADYQKVETPDSFETVFKSANIAAMTSAGAGYVKISRQGLMSVGSLPSSTDVVISPYQAAVTQEPG